VVTNLVSNAISYTPQGGRVEIELRSDGSEAVLTVNDTGVGIPADFLPHVFEAFRRSDTSSKRSHRGLGIGLSVVRHLVLKHGGRVSAESDGPNLGSRFTVRLPLDPVLAPSAPTIDLASGEPEMCPPKLEGMRVLVVDDDSAVLQLIEKLLSDCEALVLTAGSVREAVKLLPRFRPHVLVSDIQMPGTDGYDLIRQVRALPGAQGGSTPALALTAFAAESDRRAVLEAGFQMHLTKPVQPQVLLDAVANLGRADLVSSN
jgi:CheY-like chemotaxis protein